MLQQRFVKVCLVTNYWEQSLWSFWHIYCIQYIYFLKDEIGIDIATSLTIHFFHALVWMTSLHRPHAVYTEHKSYDNGDILLLALWSSWFFQPFSFRLQWLWTQAQLQCCSLLWVSVTTTRWILSLPPSVYSLYVFGVIGDEFIWNTGECTFWDKPVFVFQDQVPAGIVTQTPI